MMTNSLRKKLGLTEEKRSIFIDAPPAALELITRPEDAIAPNLSGEFDYIHWFVQRRDLFEASLPTLKAHLKPTGMLWVSWPKGRGLGTDLTLTILSKIGYDHGLIESKSVSIDATWSALKFTFPKAGKRYKIR